LSLYSECRLSDDVIYERIENLPIWEKERANKFYEIFKEYYSTYKNILEENNYMDFCDMIL
jgi:superfamily I DNA/RNA helicase